MRRYSPGGFRSRFNQALGDSGLTLGQLRNKTGISYSALQCYARGKAQPTAGNLFLLCDALHVSSDWLLGLEGL